MPNVLGILAATLLSIVFIIVECNRRMLHWKQLRSDQFNCEAFEASKLCHARRVVCALSQMLLI